jgi:protoporphyrinogen/coproporphyrinogen III oxidase
MRVGIIGAGISGLAAGWLIKERLRESASVHIFEKSGRPGGWINTVERGGFLFETGPRSFRSKGNSAATLHLIESLGLQTEVISAAPAARNRYLYDEGTVRRLPTTVFEFLVSPLMRGVLPALLKEWFKKCSHRSDETVHSFISRRLSPEIAEKLVDPLITGIFAGDIRQLSIRSCLPMLYQFEQQHGSILKGLWKQRRSPHAISSWAQSMQRSPLLTFRKGMETLVQKLAEKLHDEVRYHQKVQSLEAHPDHVSLQLEGKEKIEFDQLILAVPAAAAMELLGPYLSCPSISLASVATVNLGWPCRILKEEGFGYLIPSRAKQDMLGVVWDSSAFPGQNRTAEETRLTVMMGGVHRPELLRLPAQQLIERALEGLRRHLGIKSRPTAEHVTIAHGAIPQYLVGHHQRIELFEKELAERTFSRVHLAGHAWHGVGVNDCVFRASEIALRLKDTF